MDTAVLFWCGVELHLVAHGEQYSWQSEPADEPIKGISSLLNRLPKKPYAIRLIYHGRRMDMHPVTAPKPTGLNPRAMITKVLKGEHASIGQPATVEAYDRFFPVRDAFGAMLYIEGGSQLLRVVTLLEEQGIRVDGAWPISAIFEEWSRTASPDDINGVVGLFYGQHQSLTYGRTPHGERSGNLAAVEGGGVELADVTLTSLSNAFAVFDQRSGNIVVSLSSGQIPEVVAELLNKQNTTNLSFLEVAKIVDSFAPNGLSNFLPQSFRLSQKQTRALFFSAGYALAAFGAIMAVVGFFGRLKISKMQAESARSAAACKLEIDALNANKTQIDRINTYLASARTESVPAEAFLARLNNGIPVEILIHHIHIDTTGFTVTGTNFGGAEVYAKFVDDLVRPNDQWHLDDASAAAAHRRPAIMGNFATEPSSVSNNPDFSIKGFFRTPDSNAVAANP